ncbi:MAG: hypothetical protein ACRDQB_03025, partial [Thermocrispum sp.]
TQPHTPMPAPLAEGVTSGTADPSATAATDQGATVSAAGEQQHHGPVGGGQQQAQSFQQQAQAAGAMPPGAMQPMSGGAGMGGAAAGAGGVGGAAAEGDQGAASYLIQPDPDDVFGPTEAVTSGVIGADPDDDDL